MNIRLYAVCLLLCLLAGCIKQGDCNSCPVGSRVCYTFGNGYYSEKCYNETTQFCCGNSADGNYGSSTGGYGGGYGGYGGSSVRSNAQQRSLGALCDFVNASCCEGAGSEKICYDAETQFCCTQWGDSVFPKVCSKGDTCVWIGDWTLGCQASWQFTCVCDQYWDYWKESQAICNNGQYCKCVPQSSDGGADYYNAVCSDTPACEDQRCLDCEDPSYCDRCGDDHYSYNGTCVSQCPYAYTPSGSYCQPCWEGCATCNPNYCLTCKPGYYYYRANCFGTCPVGTITNEGAKTCDAINECATNSSICPPKYECLDYTPGYACIPRYTAYCEANKYYLSFDNTCWNCYLPSSLPGPYYAYEHFNIALNKSFSASSVYSGSGGDFSPAAAADTLTTSYYQSAAAAIGETLWWQVDLLGTHSISQVRVLCKQGNTQPFNLIGKLLNGGETVLSSFTITFGANDLPFEKTFSPSVNASIFRIERQVTAAEQYLQIAEVEVYLATENATKLYGGYPNIAVNKQAWQLNEYNAPNYGPGLAVDHNLNTWQHSTETNANQHAVWSLNLGTEHTISGLNLVPRIDYGADRFFGYVIKLRNLRNDVVATLNAGDKNLRNFSYTFDPMVTAIHIRIDQIYTDNKPTFMHMSEFELYGFVANGTRALQECAAAGAACPVGYYRNGSNCDDVNECLYPVLYNCNTTLQICRNTIGSYVCDCKNGLYSYVYGICVSSCPNGTIANHSNKSCDDINECANPSACPPTYTCSNTVGSYTCTAPSPPTGCSNNRYYLASDKTCYNCYITSPLPGPFYAYARTNIALNKTLSTSNVSATVYPAAAIDTLTTTYYQSAPSGASGEVLWWQVDLQGAYNIAEVRVICKQDNVQAFSLNGKLLSANDTIVSSFTISFGPNDLPFQKIFSTSVNASKFRIERQATGMQQYLQIAEVEVYAVVVNDTKLYGGYPNIAVSKQAWQLNEYQAPNYGASLAVDHNLATFQHSLEVNANQQAAWTLNLGLEHTISGLNLVPRVDYGADRFFGYVITLRNLKNEVVATLNAGDKNLRNFSYTFDPMVTAIHVRIDQFYTLNTPTFMHMSEFELYGFVANTTVAYEECRTPPGSCAIGFYKNDSVCLDYDECLYPALHNCTSNLRVCRNTYGSYECVCKSGFGGPNCTDINECEIPNACIEGKKCSNTVGSFSCSVYKQYFLKSKHTGFVATAGAKGASVVVAAKKSSNFTDQLWSFVPGEGGFFQNIATGHVLDIQSGSSSPGAYLITWPKKTGYNLNQQWSYNNATFVFKSKISNVNLVFDVKSGSTKPNTPLIVWTPKSSATNQNQRFELEEHVN